MNTKAVAKVQAEEDPRLLALLAQDDTGDLGYSTDAEDNTMPLLYILHALSPAVKKTDPSYVQGAEPGDFWLRNSSIPLIKGTTGGLFQQVKFKREHVEWAPKESGGGIRARYADPPKEAKLAPNGKLMMPNGNEIVDTRYHTGIMRMGSDSCPIVIPLKSTGLTVSKNWSTTMSLRRKPNGNPYRAYELLYSLTTVERSNVKGSWYQLVPTFSRVATIEEIEEGLLLHKAVMAGDKVMDNEEEAATQQSDKF